MKALNSGIQSTSAFKGSQERLQGVLVYEDLETGTRAKDVCDHLLYQIEVDADIQLALWRFDLLRDPDVNKQAAIEAAAADLVVLSVHDDSVLPPEVTLWLRRWLDEKKGDGRSVLIISLDQDRLGQSGEARILASLRTMVEAAGVDLIPHYGASKDGLARSAERIWERAEAKSSRFLDNRMPLPATLDHWGLNE